VPVQQQLATETKAIAALKQHYERYHGKDLAALKELYEYHAANSVRAAELTVDPRRREEYLKLAREWTEAADKAKPADDAPSANARPAEVAGDLLRRLAKDSSRTVRRSLGITPGAGAGCPRSLAHPAAR
jgi:hypothetical protein